MNKKNVLLTALAIAGFAVTSSAQTVPNYVPTNGLLGWWPFNGNANDASGNNNNGTPNTIFYVNDRFGNANSSANFPNNNTTSKIDLGTAINPSVFTISVWCYRTNQRANGFNVLISKYFQSTGFELQYLGFIVPNGSTPNGIADPATHPLNTWEHLIAVYDGSYAKMYRNNTLISTCILSPGGTIGDSLPQPSYSSGNNNLTIGDRVLGTGYEFNFEGNLDDIGIWNRALTQTEITGLYNANITGFNPVTYQNTIKIWPNPTNDHITIDNGNLANLTGHQIKISNSLGQQVFQSSITQQQFYVDMSTWGGNGIYFVNLINAQGITIETRKIVLQ